MELESMTLLTSIVLGIGLAAACGFRVFVPLLFTSMASLGGQLTLSPGFEWLGTWPVLVILAIATALEIGGYYVPWLDNLLDTIATPAAMIAGTVLTAAVVGDMEPALKWAISLIAGGGTAGTVQAITVVTRGASSVVTGGLSNPGVSTVEAGGALFTTVMALLLPYVALVIVLVFILVVGSYAFRRWKRKKNLSEISRQREEGMKPTE